MALTNPEGGRDEHDRKGTPRNDEELPAPRC